MDRFEPEQTRIETTPTLSSTEKPPEWHRRVREVGPVGLLVIGIGIALMSPRWLGEGSEPPTQSDVQMRVVRTAPTEKNQEPITLGQPVTITVRPVSEPTATDVQLPETTAEILLPSELAKPPVNDTVELVTPESTIEVPAKTKLKDPSDMAGKSEELSKERVSETDTVTEQLPTFTWSGQTVQVETRANPAHGEERFVVTIDGTEVQTLRSPNREFNLSFHPASGYRSTWDEHARTLRLVVQSGHPIWGLTYRFDDGHFTLVDVDAYEPKPSELADPGANLLAHSAELFASGKSEHRQLTQLAQQFVDMLHAPDAEQRLYDYYQKSRAHLADRHWQRFWQQDRETLTSYRSELATIVIDPIDLMGYDRGPIFRLNGLPFGLHARSFTKPDRTRGETVSFYFVEPH